MKPQYCFEEFTSVFSPPKGPMIGLWLLPRMESDQGLFFGLADLAEREGFEPWDGSLHQLIERGRVDVVGGSPGPVPPHKGYRAIPLGSNDLLPQQLDNSALIELSLGDTRYNE